MMLRYLTKLVTSFKQQIIPMFCRVPISTRVADELYQAQVDLLSAQHNAEHWTCQVGMLEQRFARLRVQLENAYASEPITISIDPQTKFSFDQACGVTQ